MRNERCVILAVTPADVDFHNSSILADAKEVDPLTKRTLPVITKADRVDIGAEKPVIDLLYGKKTDEFTLGFHAVKCRGQKDVDEQKSLKTSLDDEQLFFDSKEPWLKISDRSLLGIPALKTKLSTLYMRMVKEQVPMIVDEVDKLLAKANRTLATFGENMSAMESRRALSRELERNFQQYKEVARGVSIAKEYQPRDTQNCTHRARIQEKYVKFGATIHDTKLSRFTRVEDGDKVIVYLNGKEIRLVVHKVIVTAVNSGGNVGASDRNIYVRPDSAGIQKDILDQLIEEGIVFNRTSTLFNLIPFIAVV